MPGSPEVEKGERSPWRTLKDVISDLPPLDNGGSYPADPYHIARKLPEHYLRLISAIPKNGGTRFDAPQILWLPAHRRAGKRKFSDVFARLRWEEPSVTITTGFTNPSKGRFVHPEQNRGLTLREGARLQTFPDDFTFIGSFPRIEAQIGEAFPPVLAEKIARSVT
jgi:DNA (cytosine-5)-methyltransferase 1